MEKIMLDGVQLYHDLREHFGTTQFWCSTNSNQSWGPSYNSNPLYDRANGFHNDNIINDYTKVAGTIKGACGVPIAEGVLGALDAAWQNGDYDYIIELAIDEGFNLDQYRI